MSQSKQEEYIRVDQVSKVYSKRNWRGQTTETVAVDDLSLSIYKGETLGLVGESGSGKSTLARLILGLEKPSQGKVTYLEGVTDGKRLQIIYQDPFSALNPSMTALEIVKEPLFNWSKDKAEEAAIQILERVGITGDDIYKRPRSFSGGQRQRIGIARAVVSHPDFIVCDEPTSALDVSIQAQILNILKELQEELGLSYLFISHDLSVVRHISDRIAVMYHGHLVEVAPADHLFDHPQHAYTKYLLAAKMDLDPVQAREKLGQLSTYNQEFHFSPSDEWVMVGEDHYVRRSTALADKK
ncbi:ATP-binding cassette domain-containing protein [Streptococcus sp. DD13]|uniref:ATP-binding cassette domain-containing protein n=1 Tax=Streptococcus sp. DD13 TaxID=1777881 RepID=UPI0007934455|nr:ATP-binding cassette domain-containing protein [Streptococcus sp. DD13]KXT78157.1 Oligopeptide transport ATP-binding protein OppF [Streptococcus sp. DD13]